MKNKFTLAQNLIGDGCRCEFLLVLSDGSQIVLATFLNFDDLQGERLEKVRSIDGGMAALESLVFKTFQTQLKLI